MEILKNKKTLFFILSFFLLLVFVVYFLIAKKEEPVKTQNLVSVYSLQEYKNANQLLSEKKYDEADVIFKELENHSLSMDQLALLKIKQLRIKLARNEHSDAVILVADAINNPNFPNSSKARMMESLMTGYFASNNNLDFYNTIFSIEPFKNLKSTSTEQQSLYNYAEYSYAVYPTTVMGVNVIFNRINQLDLLDKNGDIYDKKRAELASFVDLFFKKSDSELTSLETTDGYQEIALINMRIERANVIGKLSRSRKWTSEDKIYTMEDELVSALRVAQKLNDPFYLFHATYNYINFLVVTNSSILPEFEKYLLEKDFFFSSKNISREQYQMVLKNTVKLTTAQKNEIRKINKDLYDLIQGYDLK